MLYELAFLSIPWVAGLVLIGFLVWLSVLVESDEGSGATISLFLFLAFLQAFTNFHPFSLALDYPVRTLLVVALYFAAGTLWCVVKWFSFVYRARDVYEACREKYLKQMHLTDSQLTGRHVYDIKNNAERQLGFSHQESLPPLVRQHTDRIMVWMAYWPVSAFWTLFKDPIARICRWIVSQIGGTLQAVSAKAFAGFKDDFLK